MPVATPLKSMLIPQSVSITGGNSMNINLKLATAGLVLTVSTATSGISLASDDAANYCMDVVIEPFHMQPDMQPEGTCTVRDYWDGDLQEAFYPFTEEEHLFNCEYFGPLATLPTGVQVPSAVVSQGNIVGTIGGHPFEASLACASLTNWYQDSCTEPDNPMSCTFQMAQPFITTHPRVTEVSIFDGAITVDSGGRSREVPIVMATRAAGITHLEDLEAPLVGASMPATMCSSVDLPQPLGPRKVKNSPSAIFSQHSGQTSRRSGWPPPVTRATFWCTRRKEASRTAFQVMPAQAL